jgi:plasmid stabilization system protein ParE
VKVVLTGEARIELAEIWVYNAKRWGVRHADGYLEFLDHQLEELSGNFERGKAVSSRPDLRYLSMRKSGVGYAHIAVYSVQADKVVVLHVFHEAQDWENKLAEE